ncbi:hypothetical protein LTR53_019333, partial [Teratosphaeriaceae sp. CCFEE 6253]
SRASVSTTSSQRTAALALAYHAGPPHGLSEKEKMLRGRPFRAYHDRELLADRAQCRAALERFNDAARASSNISSEEIARFFRAVVEPPFRPGYRAHEPYTGPRG